MAMLEEGEDEEREGLLARPAGQAQRPHAADGARDSPEGGLCARLAAAWRRPLGPQTAAPAFVKQLLVCTEEEEECLEQLRHLAAVSFDREDPVHERTLNRFFAAVRSPAEARELEPGGKDKRWQDLGFQSQDPRTDFRGGGLLALQNMLFLAESYPERTKRMLQEAANNGGGRNEYLFAASCVNISAILVLLLGLNATPSMSPVRGMPMPVHALARKNFARALRSGAAGGSAGAAALGRPAEEAGGSAPSRSPPQEVLGELFVSAVTKLHAEWGAVCARKPTANLLDFGDALSATSVALERFLGSADPSAGSPHAVFAPLQHVEPASLSTKVLNQVARCRSSTLEALCRLASLLAELLGCAGVSKRRRVTEV